MNGLSQRVLGWVAEETDELKLQESWFFWSSGLHSRLGFEAGRRNDCLGCDARISGGMDDRDAS